MNKKYQVGSHLFKTNTEKSDYDFIEVGDKQRVIEGLLKENVDYKFFTFKQFETSLNNHDVDVLECYLLNNLQKDYPNFKLDLGKLRKSFSTVSSHSWVKGKKKLITTSDYEKYVGIKSIFHSIRILDYGIQIATEKNIIESDRYKWLLLELIDLSNKYERNELWEVIESRYKSLYKDLKSQFKQLIPKELLQTTSVQNKLINILQSHKIIVTKELLKDIKELYE